MAKRSQKMRRRISSLLSRIRKSAMMSKDGCAISDSYLATLDGEVKLRTGWRKGVLVFPSRSRWMRIIKCSPKQLRVLCKEEWHPRDPMSPLETLARQLG